MFIQTENTPNPNVLKFLPGQSVMGEATASFTDAESAKISPLASALFVIENVEGIFFGGDFISVTKSAGADWINLKPAILTTIMEHFITGMPIINNEEDDSKDVKNNEQSDEPDSEIVVQIKELLDTRVRPAVAEDGGDIIYHGFTEDGWVQLELHGACAGCPSATVTLKNGIENLLKHYIPEVVGVEAINDTPYAYNPYSII